MKKLPTIKRAKGFRLYTHGNKRLLDLSREQGCAILGHRVGGAVLAMKNELEKGLLPSFSTVELARLQKAVATLYPFRQDWIIFPDEFWARDYLTRKHPDFKTLYPSDFENIYFWQPHREVIVSPIAEMENEPCALLARLPFAFANGPVAVSGIATPNALMHGMGPISPVVLAGAKRAVYDYIHFLERKGIPSFEWFDELQSASLGDNPRWKRTGPYICFLGSDEEYEKLIKTDLEQGIFLSRGMRGASLLPLELSEGEKALVGKVLF